MTDTHDRHTTGLIHHPYQPPAGFDAPQPGVFKASTVIFPSVAAHCITPICPHMLTNRPVIVPDDRVIKIILRSGNTTYLTVDGQAGKLLTEGDEVVCRRSEHFVHLILQPHMKFFDVLREKLSWGGR